MKRNLLKKLTAISLSAILLIFSCISVFATTESTFTPDYSRYEVTQLPNLGKLDADTENQIKTDYINSLSYGEYTTDDIIVDYYGTLNDGSMLVFAQSNDMNYIAVITYIVIGDYIYVTPYCGVDVKIYKDNSFYAIKDLYEAGELTDIQLDEVADYLNFESFFAGNATKADLLELLEETAIVGSNYTPETGAPFYEAVDNAQSVYENPDATQFEIDTAYFELDRTFAKLEVCDWDIELLELYYEYGNEICNSYSDCFSEASMDTLSESVFSAYMALLYGQSQEEVDSASAELENVLKNLELTTENPDVILYDEFMQIYTLADTYLNENKSNEFTETYVYTPVFTDFNGYRIVPASTNEVMPMQNSFRTGKYIIETNNIYTPTEFGYLAVNADTGDVIALETAIKNGIVDSDKLFESYQNYIYSFDMYITGDTNYDNTLSIRDATLIQKTAAGLTREDTKKLSTDTVFDYNNDGTVNVVDATDIQKTLVL